MGIILMGLGLCKWVGLGIKERGTVIITYIYNNKNTNNNNKIKYSKNKYKNRNTVLST